MSKTRSIELTLGVVVVLALTACASAPASIPSEAEVSVKAASARECGQRAVNDLDDGVSSAQIVGQSVASACSKEFAAFATLSTIRSSAGDSKLAYMQLAGQGLRNLMDQLGTQMVLRHRASVRK